MAEEWLDCPALGPGWKRREVFRKSGATCGRSDTYYQSPTGDRIRSKVELIRYLGPSCDLSLFDFKQGILCYPAPKVQNLALPGRKRKKPSKPVKARKCQVGPKRVEVRKEAPGAKTKADADTAPASLPAPGHCENCGISFSGDGTGRQRLKTLCKDCRAQRIAFNREQRMFKRVGCGECAACRVTEDCGACSTCLLQLPHDVASGLFCKCERRRCLKIVEKSRGCGVCRGCQTREDCGRCRVCLRPPRPGLRRQWRCIQRRCLRGKRSRRRGGCDSKMAARRRSRTQPLPPLPPPQPPKTPALQPYTNRRQNRKCGACAACQRRMDCGHCDFCCDKPKFGGSNQKRQKCRWRQCLQFAMKRLLPNVWAGSEDGAASPPPIPRRKRPGSTRRPRVGHSLKTPSVTPTVRTNQAQTPVKQETGNGFVLPPPGTDLVFLREGASSPVQVPGPAPASTEPLLQVKQEKVDAQEDWTPGRAILTSPVSLRGCPSKAVDSGLPVVKQEPPDSEEEKEKSKDDSASDSAPKEQARGAGTPVRAKPPEGQKADQQLERILRSYQKHHAILNSVKSLERHRLKVDWFQHNDRRFVDSLVKTRIKDAMQGFLINTEERRNKLRELLAAEENEYFTEMQLKEETIEERKEKMKAKTRYLKEKKEKERQDFVAEKLDQQFRERCEEFRAQLQSLHEKRVCEERKAQVAFNEELKRQKLVEEQMFCKLWEEDRLAKERREAEEAERQKELEENTRLGLNAQITEINARRRAAQQLKEEEGRLVENDRAQVKFEDEQDKLKKQRSKQKLRNTLQKALQEKMDRLQQEYKEETDFRMKLTQMAQKDLQDEADKNKQKREDMIREQKIYREYLAQQREEENAQEKELDRILEEEKAKKWAEKDKQLKLEKEARKQLMNEVMCTRKLQVQEKLQRKAKELEERALEEQHILEGLKEFDRREEENFVRRSGLAQEYRKQLKMQMSYQQQAREAQKEEERRELEVGRADDKMCQDRIQELLCHPRVQLNNVHPMRRACHAKLPP